MASTRSTRKNGPAQFQQLPFDFEKKIQAKKKSKNKRDIQSESSLGEQKNYQTQYNLFELSNEAQNHGSSSMMLKQQSKQPISTTKKQCNRNKRTNKKISPQVQNNTQKISLNAQHETILEALHHLINHSYFYYLDEAKLRPTTNSQIRQMKQKLKSIYHIEQFQIDLGKLFRIFYEQSNAQKQIIQAVKTLQMQMMKKQKTQKHNFEDNAISSEAQPALKRKNSRSKSKNKDKQASMSYIEKDESFQADTISIQAKKSGKKRLTVPPRSKTSKISQIEIATLGYNISKLPSQELAVICYKYCDTSQTGATVFYNIELQKLPKQTLFQLQSDVKTIYKSKNLKYEQIDLDDSDDDFVIGSDDE